MDPSPAAVLSMRLNSGMRLPATVPVHEDARKQTLVLARVADEKFWACRFAASMRGGASPITVRDVSAASLYGRAGDTPDNLCRDSQFGCKPQLPIDGRSGTPRPPDTVSRP